MTRLTDYTEILKYGQPTDRELEILGVMENNNYSTKKSAKELGIGKRSVQKAVQRVCKRAAGRGYDPEHNLIHPVPDGYRVKAVSLNYDGDGNVRQQWVKSEINGIQESSQALSDIVKSFTDNPLFKSVGVKLKSTKSKVDDNLVNAIIIGDAHLGMLAWKESTGDENFDTDIGSSDLIKAFSYLIDTAPQAKAGLLVNLGDFFHTNGHEPLTPASKNVLDSDSRISYTLDQGIKAMRFAIDKMLSKYEEVYVINQRGNHDPDIGLCFNKILIAYYANDPRVNILRNETKLINFEWGKTLVTTHHGDRINQNRWYEQLTSDYRDLVGVSRHVYGWQGHIHHKMSKEIGCCTFESFQTLAAKDQHASDSGYSSGRSMTSVTLHKEYGEVGRNRCSIDLVRAAYE